MSGIEQARISIGRAGFAVFVGGLLVGLLSFALHQPQLSTNVLTATCGVMLMLPVVNVIAVCAEELQRRDWIFAAIGIAVLGMLGYSVVQRLS